MKCNGHLLCARPYAKYPTHTLNFLITASVRMGAVCSFTAVRRLCEYKLLPHVKGLSSDSVTLFCFSLRLARSLAQAEHLKGNYHLLMPCAELDWDTGLMTTKPAAM